MGVATTPLTPLRPWAPPRRVRRRRPLPATGFYLGGPHRRASQPANQLRTRGARAGDHMPRFNVRGRPLAAQPRARARTSEVPGGRVLASSRRPGRPGRCPDHLALLAAASHRRNPPPPGLRSRFRLPCHRSVRPRVVPVPCARGHPIRRPGHQWPGEGDRGKPPMRCDHHACPHRSQPIGGAGRPGSGRSGDRPIY